MPYTNTMSNHERPQSHQEHKQPEPQLIVVKQQELYQHVQALLEQRPINPALPLLFTGDRITCCDEGIVLRQQETVLGLASIAPFGEGVNLGHMRTQEYLRREGLLQEDELTEVGQPTIVGLYVPRHHRGKGYGEQILHRTIERCVERGFTNIRLDVMNSHALRMLERLPEEIRQHLDIHDFGTVMDTF